MKDLLKNLPENVNITVSKQDLIEFANSLIKSYTQSNKEPGGKHTIFKSIINVNDAVLLTGLSKSTIYQKVCKGAMPHYKRGGKLYFKSEELEDWLLENKVA